MKKHIICFGDSNTHGYNGDTLKRFDENERWTCLLQKILENDYLILEEGLGGRTTVFEDPLTEGLSSLPLINPILKSHEPVDLLIIMLGTNDTKSRFSLTSEEIAFGLERLVKKAKVTECWNDKTRILIVVPKNIDKEYENSPIYPQMGPGCHEKSIKLAKLYKEVALRNDCYYLDANEYVTNNNHTDYMHIDKKGHEELAKALASKIKEIF